MISILIPTHHNRERLKKNLRQNIQFISLEDEIIIVNDYPQDNLSTDIKEFSNIRLIQHSENKGFAGTINDAAEIARGEYLFLLNDDVVLRDTSYQEAIQYFQNDVHLFAVSFAQLEKNNQVVGRNCLYWKRGMPYHKKAINQKTGITAWAEGGTMICSTEKWRKLKGFSTVYNPFYWEDIDLSYRAWKSGYTVLFTSEILVEHQHESTIGTQFTKKAIKRTAFRNQFLFTWYSITDISYKLNHFFFLMWNLLYYTVAKREILFLYGFFDAIFIKLKKYNAFTSSFTKTDKEILSKLSEYRLNKK